jgi:hypothetical protein
MITGDLGSPGYLPLANFRWNFDPKVLRVLVHSSDRASLYIVDSNQVTGTVQTSLSDGWFSLSCEDGTLDQGQILTGEFVLNIPNHTPCEMVISPE